MIDFWGVAGIWEFYTWIIRGHTDFKSDWIQQVLIENIKSTSKKGKIDTNRYNSWRKIVI